MNKTFINIELDNIHSWDYPDFADACAISADVELEDGTTREATEEEIEELNKDSQYIYDLVLNKIF